MFLNGSGCSSRQGGLIFRPLDYPSEVLLIAKPVDKLSALTVKEGKVDVSEVVSILVDLATSRLVDLSGLLSTRYLYALRNI